MEKLRERLTAAGFWTPRLERLVAALWRHGVGRIGEAGLRETVADYLVECAPAAFFTENASRNPAMHPPWQHQVNGCLRGIVESCVLIPAMARYVPGMLDAARNPIPLAVDVALSATIVSDTFRIDDAGMRPGAEHGKVAAEAWRVFALAKRRTYPYLIEKVADAAHWHFGVYAPDWHEGIELAPEAFLTHLCDAFTAQTALALIYEERSAIGSPDPAP